MENQDLWSVSDAEFDVNSMSGFGSEEQSTEPEQQEEVQEDQQQHEEYTQQESEQVQEESLYDAEPTEEQSVETTGSDGINYEAEYRKVVGTPFKANGKEITVDSAEDAIKLMQMGANYHKQMQQLKPAKRVIAMLEQAGLMDEQKLNHVIDIMNGNSQAIHKLIQERNIDVSDLYSNEEIDYTPNQHQVSDERIEIDTLFNELNGTEHGKRVLQDVVGGWDEKSRHAIGQTPDILRVLSSQVENGIYDVIVAEVDKQRMLGNIPANAPMLQAYEQVGKYLQANGRLTPTSSKHQGQTAPVQRTTVASQQQATAPTGSNTRKRVANSARTSNSSTISQQMENVFAMSDEEFKRKYS